MGTLMLNQIKKQASSFLQKKYKTARLTFTDVTQAELLAEEATNNDPCGPDAKTMTQIAEASFDVDDYWRIVDILHRRFYSIDWKQWRISYKSLVLLEFLLTHGPEDFAEEFQCDTEIIQELAAFQYIDDKGFDWGANMQKRSDHILSLLGGGSTLRDARLKAIKITREIKGFGNSVDYSPPFSSSSSSPTSSTDSSRSASSWNDHLTDLNNNKSQSSKKNNEESTAINKPMNNNIRIYRAFSMNKNFKGSHIWDCPTIEEGGSLIDGNKSNRDVYGDQNGLMSSICSRFGLSPTKKVNGDKVPFRSFSNVESGVKKRYGRQSSLGY